MSTRKVVINKCFGGFRLSPRAVQRIAELQGRPCYFFELPFDKTPRQYVPLTLEQAGKAFMAFAFDIPNPNEVLGKEDAWHSLTQEQRQTQNRLHESHALDNRPHNRADPLLVQVVEELGEAANGTCAKLAIVEIPDGVEYEISEYDGREHIAEAHRTWG